MLSKHNKFCRWIWINTFELDICPRPNDLQSTIIILISHTTVDSIISSYMFKKKGEGDPRQLMVCLNLKVIQQVKIGLAPLFSSGCSRSRLHNNDIYSPYGTPWWLSGKESACQCRRQKSWSSLDQEDLLGKEMATHSTILARDSHTGYRLQGNPAH